MAKVVVRRQPTLSESSNAMSEDEDAGSPNRKSKTLANKLRDLARPDLEAEQRLRRYVRDQREIDNDLADGIITKKEAKRRSDELAKKLDEDEKLARRCMTRDDIKPRGKGAPRKSGSGSDTDGPDDDADDGEEGNGCGRADGKSRTNKKRAGGGDDDGEDETKSKKPRSKSSAPTKSDNPVEIVNLSQTHRLKPNYANVLLRINAVWSIFTGEIALNNNAGTMEAVTIERRPPNDSKKKPTQCSFKIRSVPDFVKALRGLIQDARVKTIGSRDILRLTPDKNGWRDLGKVDSLRYPHKRYQIDSTFVETREVKWTQNGGGSMEALSFIRKAGLAKGLKNDFSMDIPVYLAPLVLAAFEAIEEECFLNDAELPTYTESE